MRGHQSTTTGAPHTACGTDPASPLLLQGFFLSFPLFVIPLSSRLFSALLQLLTAIIQGTATPADCSVLLPGC